MGYTHYFPQTKPVSNATWKKIVTDVKKIIKAADIPLQGLKGRKIFSKDSIEFNSKNEGCEYFILKQNNADYAFCKTARYPYDLVVTSALLIVHHYAGHCYEISSDGDADDWSDAMRLNARVLGYAYLLPGELQEGNYRNLVKEMREIAGVNEDEDYSSENEDESEEDDQSDSEDSVDDESEGIDLFLFYILKLI